MGLLYPFFLLIINLHVLGDKPSRQHAEINVINLIDKQKTYDKEKEQSLNDHM